MDAVQLLRVSCVGSAAVAHCAFVQEAMVFIFSRLAEGDVTMDMPLISVIVPTYNRSEMLRDALECLLCQETGGEFYEIVVVDNASIDATKTVVEQAAAQRRCRCGISRS